MSGRTYKELVLGAVRELRVLHAQGKTPDDEGVGFPVSTVEYLRLCDARDTSLFIDKRDLSGRPERLCGLRLIQEKP